MTKVTVKDLFEAGCHFGHQTRRWNPKMKPYVYGNRNGITIIDLNKTIVQIASACNFLQHIVEDGGRILFVGTKRQARDLVKEAAEKTGMYYVTERWMGGTITNNVTIRKSIDRMAQIDDQLANAEKSGMKKKEMSVLMRKAENLHSDLDGIRTMKQLPSALVIVDLAHEDIAVKEANKLGIPVVALCDTNSNPDLAEYPIPANDDAVRSIQLILNVLCDGISIANELWTKKREERKAVEAERERERAEKKAQDGDADGEKKPGRRRAERAGAPAADGEKKPVRRRTTTRKPAEAPVADKKPAAKKKAEPKSDAPAAE